MKFTVIVCVYNASEKEIKDTLDSIVVQENVDFEIIIADDCSENSYEEFINEYFGDYQGIKYTYVRNAINLGTVKNLLNATVLATGVYIKPIGAGDYFFDNHVLYDVARYIEKNQDAIIFGNLVGFIETDCGKEKTPYKNPISLKCYINRDIKRMKENFLIYGDHISGASLFYEKALFKKYLEVISDRIIYVEDYIPIFAILDGEKIGYINKTAICYKLGTGISTKITNSNTVRIMKDRMKFDKLIVDYAPNDDIIKKYKSILKINRLPIVLKWVVKGFMIPKDICFRFVKERNRRCSKWVDK